jgi:hypothetical protein
MYIVNYTKPDLAFIVNLLVRYSSTLTQKTLGWGQIYTSLSP